jgi:hypothetical protein
LALSHRTARQGGAVAQALQGTGFYLRGLTRMPDSERAAALARRGVDVVKGDLDDEATLRRALAGAWGVFGVQNTLGGGRRWRARPAYMPQAGRSPQMTTSRRRYVISRDSNSYTESGGKLAFS